MPLDPENRGNGGNCRPHQFTELNNNMDSNLERYLNDHLAGSAGAVDLIQTLADHSEDPAHASFFIGLKAKVEEDRALLKGLLEKLGQSSSTMLQAAGNLTAKAGRLKLLWEGLEPGRLGTFEAMEMLTLGIQGKRLLWLILAEIAPWVPEWEGVDFAELELEAIAQRDAVEERRIEAGLDALLDPERRAKEKASLG